MSICLFALLLCLSAFALAFITSPYRMVWCYYESTILHYVCKHFPVYLLHLEKDSFTALFVICRAARNLANLMFHFVNQQMQVRDEKALPQALNVAGIASED